MQTCKICKNQSTKIFTCQVLAKYEVVYYRCNDCAFIQTEEPYWLDEAYSSAITSLDIGLIYRNLKYVPVVETLIKLFYQKDGRYIDYGGGYGMFVRMMRDKGFDFLRQDIYCENLFAKNFDVDEAQLKDEKFELLTAFEVFEHLVNPLEEFEKMLSYSSNIFFSTAVYPQDTDLLKWWYLIPETGQHVSLYSIKSLEYIAKKYELNFFSFNTTEHLFTKKKISKQNFDSVFDEKFRFNFNQKNKNPESLLLSDFNKISNIKM